MRRKEVKPRKPYIHVSEEVALAAAADLVAGFSRKEVMERRGLTEASVHRVAHTYLRIKYIWRPLYDPEN